MNNITRKHRLGVISSILTQNPNVLFPLSYFSQMFGSSKSTLSEDMAILKESYKPFSIGEIEVVMGAAGGVRFVPAVGSSGLKEDIEEIREMLSDPGRILPGGYIYTADLLFAPRYIDKISQVLWGYYRDSDPDFIITVESKGIAVAEGVARLFDRPLIVARREGRLTEGSVITINYLSGSSNRMQKMSVSKRALKDHTHGIIIDDFLAGGGTVRAVYDILREFDITVDGCGVAIATRQPEKKRIENYKSVFILEKADDAENIVEFSLSSDISF